MSGGQRLASLRSCIQGRMEVIAEAYVNYFEKGGWTTTKRERTDVTYHYGFRKGEEAMNVEIYVFDDVGVIVERLSDSPELAMSSAPANPQSPALPSPRPQPPKPAAALQPPPAPQPPAANEQYLRDLKPASVVALPEGREHQFDREFTVNKVVFKNGVYFCPPTPNSTGSAIFELGANYSRLKGGVAISDHRFGKAYSPVTFRAIGDGKTLWTSQPLQGCGEWEAFEFDVSGVQRLTLEVSCPASHTGAHASWMDPILVK